MATGAIEQFLRLCMFSVCIGVIWSKSVAIKNVGMKEFQQILERGHLSSKKESLIDVLDKKWKGSSGGSSRVTWKECNIGDDVKQDCGFYGITEEECYKRECCWGKSSTPGVAWCYHSKPTVTHQCTMHPKERMDCGTYGIRKSKCLDQGCCWQPINQNGIPWCFHEKKESVSSGECGNPVISPSVAGRIVGGKRARPHSWPWQVSLQSDSEHFCGGSIIDPMWIVSAAHCEPAFSFLGGKSYIVAGVHNLKEKEEPIYQRIEVDVVISHQGFDEWTYDKDIMLIKLKSPVQFYDEVSPICLPMEGEEFEAGLKCYTTGWGHLEEDGNSPDMLQQVMIPLIETKHCNQESWYDGQITDNMLCAGYVEGGRDACQGDSGGPMVCYHDDVWKLVGIVSWGDGCAVERKPGVYTKTSQFIHWIHDNMQKYSQKQDQLLP